MNGDDVNRRELTVGEVYQADLKDTVSLDCTETRRMEERCREEEERDDTAPGRGLNLQ